MDSIESQRTTIGSMGRIAHVLAKGLMARALFPATDPMLESRYARG